MAGAKSRLLHAGHHLALSFMSIQEVTRGKWYTMFTCYFVTRMYTLFIDVSTIDIFYLKVQLIIYL